MYDVGEDATLSQPVTVTIPVSCYSANASSALFNNHGFGFLINYFFGLTEQDLLVGYTISDAQEMMLGANQLKSESNRLPWNTQNQDTNEIDSEPSYEYKPLAVTDVVLKPMEIRTFVISVA